MSPHLLSQLATLLVGVPALGCAIAAIWAIGALRRYPRSERPDRSVAVRLAVVLAVVPLVGFPVWIGAFGSAWGGSFAQGLIGGIPLGGGVALGVLFSSLTGYAVLARPRIGSAALAGVLLGPLVFGGATAVMAEAKGMADAAYFRTIYGPDAIAANAREIDRVEGLLALTVMEVEARTIRAADGDGKVRTLVEGVRLTLVVHADERIQLADRLGAEPHAWFFPGGAQASGFDVRLSKETISEIAAGDTTYVIEDRWPDRSALAAWPDAPQPGPWTVHLILELPGIETGQNVDVAVDFEVLPQ